MPIALLVQAAPGSGASAAIHACFALGAGFMARAVFDFRLPTRVNRIAAACTGALAVVFAMQGASEVLPNPSLTNIAYQILGQYLERGLGNLVFVWCGIAVWVDSRGKIRMLGLITIAIVAVVEAYSLYLLSSDVSLDAKVPALKLLSLLPFVWLLLESAPGHRWTRTPPNH